MKEIVIKVDDKTYEDILIGRIYSSPRDVPQEAIKAIRNGKELPKGHRGLKDIATIIDKIADTDIYLTDEDWAELGKALKSAETLVEADKGEE